MPGHESLRPLRRLALSMALLSLLSCSSSYRPVRSARIATTLDSGELTLLKGDQAYSVGVIGTELVQAVQGNPAAEEHARAFRNKMITGWTFYGVGVGVTLAGAGLLGTGIADSDAGNEGVGLGITAAGLGFLFAGMGFIMNGQPHLFDAINIYNDGVDASFRAVPLGATKQGAWQQPASTAPTLPLEQGAESGIPPGRQ